MVWVYGNVPIRRDATRPDHLYRALFQTKKGTLLFGGFVLTVGDRSVLLYSSGYRMVGGDAERTVQVIGSIGLTPLLLHFYLDSFNWKGGRRKSVRRSRFDRMKHAARAQPIAPAQASGRFSL